MTIFVGKAAVLIGSLLFCAVAVLPVDAMDATEREKEFQNLIRPILQKACIDCHSGAEADAGLSLQHFQTFKSILKERRTWEKVIQKVQIGDMPPKDAPPLSNDDRKKLVEWINGAIQDIDCGKTPNPGLVTLRRLNRAEYRNTVRDLVGIDYKTADDFPGDDVGYGFDNIGDVLTLPPLLMEKYLTAAEEISRQAIQAPDPSPPSRLRTEAHNCRIQGESTKWNRDSTFIVEVPPQCRNKPHGLATMF